MIRIKKGIDLPLSGAPEQKISGEFKPTRVAVTAIDYVGMKPKMNVSVGDSVVAGQCLFVDKKYPSIQFTATTSGKVVEINRGAKRLLHSVVIETSGNEQVSYQNYKSSDLQNLNRENVVALLLESGLWPALRTRPFSKSPDPESTPAAIFVNAMDTHPLCADPALIIGENAPHFEMGLKVLTKLTQGKLYLCKKHGTTLPGEDLVSLNVQSFEGPHPAGLSGTHMHFIDPVSINRTHWSIGYQDVLRVGELFATGVQSFAGYISLAGPKVNTPTILKTKLGACLCQLVKDRISTDNTRVISGSVLDGRTKSDGLCYLGRFHNQVTVVEEGNKREFLGWHAPGFEKFSVKNVFISRLFSGKKFNFNTNTNGSPRSVVPVGSYEKVMPLEILATPLIKSLLTGNTDFAQSLGCLELDEEDLALLTYVCPSKIDFGPVLRDSLEKIEKEG
ncbi:MAG: Na(+)-translocating NADH-quinone reductase subunit A [Bacteriovoracaceae bacterium]|jgi:Na+-transporting NADH:ubiquinone oxidoreductase subunit A|nr:Na(+)-translocating NADH-quinone reductase subunit A [Bacteriovoracaceae bacterium]